MQASARGNPASWSGSCCSSSGSVQRLQQIIWQPAGQQQCRSTLGLAAGMHQLTPSRVATPTFTLWHQVKIELMNAELMDVELTISLRPGT